MKFKLAFILVSLSCLSRAIAAPASAPSTQPTTQPAVFTTGVNAAAKAVVSFTASAVPAVVHVHALNLLVNPTDWLEEQFIWDFGDPAGQTVTNPNTGKLVNINTAQHGPVAAYLYVTPGTYTVTLTRTKISGETNQFRATIIVPPSHRTVYYIAPDGSDGNIGTDAAHAFLTAGLAARKVTDHTEFRFCRGGHYSINGEFALKHRDIVIDCFGDPAAPLPVLYRTGKSPATTSTQPTTTAANDDDESLAIPAYGLVFSFWHGLSADITIRHLRIDSPFTNTCTTGKYAYHMPAASFGILRGDNISITDCEFDHLLEGPHGDPALFGSLLYRNRQVDPLGIPSRTLWLEGHDIVAIGNIATNSVNESPLRAAATGIIRGVVAFNTIAQQLDPAHDRATAKAAVTLRTLCDTAVYSNRITNGEFSFDPHSETAFDERIAVSTNAVFGSFLHIKSNVRNAVFSNNTITRAGGPCITITSDLHNPAMWIQNLFLQNNQGFGWQGNGRMLQIDNHSAASLQDFNFNPAANRYAPTTAPTTQP